MHGTALPIVPPLHSMLLGFMEADLNGHRVAAHGGDTQYFHSDLNLFIDDGVGFYVSMNSTGKDGAAGLIRSWLLEQFADRYFPAAPDRRSIDAKTAAQHARVMAGRYEPSRRAQSNFMSLFFLPGQLTVGVSDKSGLSVPELLGYNGEPKRWREVTPFVWNEIDGKERLAAKVENGRVEMFSSDAVSPFDVFLPVPWWRSSVWLMPLLLVGLAALLLTVIAWPVGAVVRRRLGVSFPPSGTSARAYRLTRLAALATLVIPGAWVATLAPIATNLAFYSSRIDWWIWTLHLTSAVVFLAAAAVGVWNVWITWTTPRGWGSRVWSAVLAMGYLAMLWVAVVFRLIAFNANY